MKIAKVIKNMGNHYWFLLGATALFWGMVLIGYLTA